MLHGMTRRGANHPELRRFTRALASTGARVLVPEIREWAELDFAPERAQQILRASVEWLHDSPGIRKDGVMVVGFSFGAPQALVAASRPEIAGKLKGVVGWGGFADLQRTLEFAFVGEHEWEGATYHQSPDPYVRWIIGSNCLPFSDRLDPDGRVADGLHRLAAATGEKRIRPGQPEAAAMESEIANALAGEDRELFRLFAPVDGGRPDRGAAEAVIAELIPLARREVPLLDPLPAIGRIEVPVRLLHARSDRLIPFTESLRMERALDGHASDLGLRITGLLGHSGEAIGGGRIARAWENLRFLDALRSVFEIA